MTDGPGRYRQVLDEVRAGAVLAAQRDATAYNCPSTSSGPRSHCGGKYHAVTARDGGTAACSGRVVLLVEEARHPAGLDPVLFCRRPACLAKLRAAR